MWILWDFIVSCYVFGGVLLPLWLSVVIMLLACTHILPFKTTVKLAMPNRDSNNHINIMLYLCIYVYIHKTIRYTNTTDYSCTVCLSLCYFVKTADSTPSSHLSKTTNSFYGLFAMLHVCVDTHTHTMFFFVGECRYAAMVVSVRQNVRMRDKRCVRSFSPTLYHSRALLHETRFQCNATAASLNFGWLY